MSSSRKPRPDPQIMSSQRARRKKRFITELRSSQPLRSLGLWLYLHGESRSARGVTLLVWNDSRQLRLGDRTCRLRAMLMCSLPMDVAENCKVVVVGTFFVFAMVKTLLGDGMNGAETRDVLARTESSH